MFPSFSSVSSSGGDTFHKRDLTLFVNAFVSSLICREPLNIKEDELALEGEIHPNILIHEPNLVCFSNISFCVLHIHNELFVVVKYEWGVDNLILNVLVTKLFVSKSKRSSVSFCHERDSI
jgi:hypothetical protein